MTFEAPFSFATILFSTQQHGGKSDSEKFSWHKKFYQRLKSLGWTQQRSTKAKGLKSQGLVSERIQLNSLSDKVKNFITEDKITEENLREIIRLSLSDTLSPWLTTSQAWKEMAEKALSDRAKNGSRPVKEYHFCRQNWRQKGDKLKRTGCHQKAH